MGRMTGTRLALPAAIALSLAGPAPAQDAALQAQLEELQQRYEEAIAAADYATITSLYAEDAVYSPLTGDVLRGREAIAGFYEQLQLTSVDVRSTRTESLRDGLVIDFGTFAATAAGEEGDMALEGEYVALLDIAEDPSILSLTAFPTREPMEGAGQ